MSRKYNDREDQPRRKGNRREKKTWLIACDGPTEERYLRRIIEKWELRHSLNITVKSYEGNLNKGILSKYKNKLYNNQKFDCYWFVFDKDAIQEEEFHFLCKATREYGAWSNMSFELWLLLHYRSVQQEADNARLKSDLSKTLNNRYEKTEEQIEMIDLNKVETALTHADNLEKKWGDREDYADHNPRTTVFRLINAMLEARNTH